MKHRQRRATRIRRYITTQHCIILHGIVRIVFAIIVTRPPKAGGAKTGRRLRDIRFAMIESSNARGFSKGAGFAVSDRIRGKTATTKCDEQHNTTQHHTTQHNTTQHNTTQHNTTQQNASGPLEPSAAPPSAARLRSRPRRRPRPPPRSRPRPRAPRPPPLRPPPCRRRRTRCAARAVRAVFTRPPRGRVAVGIPIGGRRKHKTVCGCVAEPDCVAPPAPTPRFAGCGRRAHAISLSGTLVPGCDGYSY